MLEARVPTGRPEQRWMEKEKTDLRTVSGSFSFSFDYKLVTKQYLSLLWMNSNLFHSIKEKCSLVPTKMISYWILTV